jgi:hypothetical protein
MPWIEQPYAFPWKVRGWALADEFDVAATAELAMEDRGWPPQLVDPLDTTRIGTRVRVTAAEQPHAAKELWHREAICDELVQPQRNCATGIGRGPGVKRSALLRLRAARASFWPRVTMERNCGIWVSGASVLVPVVPVVPTWTTKP